MEYTEEIHAKRLKECILKGLTDFCPPARDFKPYNKINELWEGDSDPCEICCSFVKEKEFLSWGSCPCNRLRNPIEDSRQILIEKGYMSDHKLEDFKVGDLVQILDKSIGGNQISERNQKGNLLYVTEVQEDRLSCWITKDTGFGDHFLPSDLLILEQQEEWIKLEKTYEDICKLLPGVTVKRIYRIYEEIFEIIIPPRVVYGNPCGWKMVYKASNTYGRWSYINDLFNGDVYLRKE